MEKLSERRFSAVWKFSEYLLEKVGLLDIKGKIILPSSELTLHIINCCGDVIGVGTFIISYDKSFLR